MRGRRGERDKGGELRRQRWTGGATCRVLCLLYCRTVLCWLPCQDPDHRLIHSKRLANPFTQGMYSVDASLHKFFF